MSNKEETLDPKDWNEVNQIGVEMLQYMLDYHKNIETFTPQFLTEEEKSKIYEPIPRNPQGLNKVWHDYLDYIDPSKPPVTSPRFWAFVAGTGSAQGMLAEMLATGINTAALFSSRSSQHVTIQVLN